MYIILFLILASLIVAISFFGAFWWALKSGQYDDDQTPAMRILLDDEPTSSNK